MCKAIQIVCLHIACQRIFSWINIAPVSIKKSILVLVICVSALAYYEILLVLFKITLHARKCLIFLRTILVLIIELKTSLSLFVRIFFIWIFNFFVTVMELFDNPLLAEWWHIASFKSIQNSGKNGESKHVWWCCTRYLFCEPFIPKIDFNDILLATCLIIGTSYLAHICICSLY